METVKSWRRLVGLWIERAIEEEVTQILKKEREMGHEMKVFIGTDSQVKGALTKFATNDPQIILDFGYVSLNLVRFFGW
jgi:hypothetical protein